MCVGSMPASSSTGIAKGWMFVEEEFDGCEYVECCLRCGQQEFFPGEYGKLAR